MVELLLKVSELTNILNEVCLHLRSNLLIELKFFNYEVEVKHKGLFNVLADVSVERGLDVVALIALLNFLDPHVQSV